MKTNKLHIKQKRFIQAQNLKSSSFIYGTFQVMSYKNYDKFQVNMNVANSKLGHFVLYQFFMQIFLLKSFHGIYMTTYKSLKHLTIIVDKYLCVQCSWLTCPIKHSNNKYFPSYGSSFPSNPDGKVWSCGWRTSAQR